MGRARHARRWPAAEVYAAGWGITVALATVELVVMYLPGFVVLFVVSCGLAFGHWWETARTRGRRRRAVSERAHLTGDTPTAGPGS